MSAADEMSAWLNRTITSASPRSFLTVAEIVAVWGREHSDGGPSRAVTMKINHALRTSQFSREGRVHKAQLGAGRVAGWVGLSFITNSSGEAK